MEEYIQLMKSINTLDGLLAADPANLNRTLLHARDYLSERALAAYNKWVKTR